jgi:hypothetical protein
MKKLMMKRLLFSATMAGCLVAFISVTQARSAYDGSWDLVFVTQRGACDPTYNFNVNISNGVVTEPNLVRFRGYVAKSGAVLASVTVQDKYASGLRQTRQQLWPRDMERLRRKCAMLGLLDRATKLTSSQSENGRTCRIHHYANDRPLCAKSCLRAPHGRLSA